MYINMLEMHTIIIVIKTACLPMADISETLAELCPIGCLTLLGSPSQIPSRFPDLQIVPSSDNNCGIVLSALDTAILNYTNNIINLKREVVNPPFF